MLERVVPLHSSFVQAVEKLPGVSLVWIEHWSRTSVECYNIRCLNNIMSSRCGKLYGAGSHKISEAIRQAGSYHDAGILCNF